MAVGGKCLVPLCVIPLTARPKIQDYQGVSVWVEIWTDTHWSGEPFCSGSYPTTGVCLVRSQKSAGASGPTSIKEAPDYN